MPLVPIYLRNPSHSHDEGHVSGDTALAEKLTLDRGKKHNEVIKNLFYAEGTIIMTSSVQASQLILQTIQHESNKY